MAKSRHWTKSRDCSKILLKLRESYVQERIKSMKAEGWRGVERIVGEQIAACTIYRYVSN